MSSLDYLEIAEQASTVPSLAELRARLLADESLSPSRRRDMASGLASLAKVLGHPLDTIPADPAVLRSLLAGRTPAMLGLKPGRWRNIRSLASATLSHFRLVLVQGRIREAPSPAWLAILGLLSGEVGPHFHLWRFARYATLQGIEPAAVGDAVLAAYQKDLESRSLVCNPARAARDAARFWNAAADSFSGWPQQRLEVPDNRRSFALAWDAFPSSLMQDIDAWHEWLSGADPFHERPFLPLRPASVATRRRQLRAYLGALVLQGVKPEDLVNLAAVVTPAQAQLALRFFWERAGKRATVHLHQMAGLVIMIARHWVKLPAPEIERLRTIADKLRPTSSGMTRRNIARLRQLEDPERLQALLTLPDTLMDKARRAGAPSVHSSRLVQTAVAVDLLLNIPMRLGNLRGLPIGIHLLRSPGLPMSISLPADEVKNGVPIDARLPPKLTKLITAYLDRYRPLLASKGGDWLFPAMHHDAPKSADGLRSQIQKAIADHCGLRFHPHLFRHTAAWITLRHNPDAHGQVQRILGHKSLGSTMNFYSGLENSAALEHYDALIDGERQELEFAGRARNRKGNGR